MRDGVLHEDTAYEWSCLSQQMTGHRRETNKKEPTLSDTYTCTYFTALSHLGVETPLFQSTKCNLIVLEALTFK